MKLKAKVTKTHSTTQGTLYEGSIVRLDKHNEAQLNAKLVRVTDELGKIYHINLKHLIIL